MIVRPERIRRHPFLRHQDQRNVPGWHPPKNELHVANFKNLRNADFDRRTAVQVPTNVCKLPRGRYAISPGDAATNNLAYTVTNSFPMNDLSLIVEWRPDRDGAVAGTDRYLFDNAAAGNNNRTFAAIPLGTQQVHFYHCTPAGVATNVFGNIIGGLLCGELYEFLFVRDDDGATDPNFLAIYQRVAGAWVLISGVIAGGFAVHNAVPANLYVGNDWNTAAACWGAWELLCVKPAYDPTWNPTDAEAIADSTWCAVYRGGGLNADTTSGGDAAAPVNTGFIAVSLATDAAWQNRDNIANYLAVTVPKALGVNRGAVCMDISPLVIPSAVRVLWKENPTAGNNNLLSVHSTATGRIRWYFYDAAANMRNPYSAAGLLSTGNRQRLHFLYKPADVYIGLDGILLDLVPQGAKGNRDGRTGVIIVPFDAVGGYACLIENIMVYADAQGTDAWCMREFLAARRFARG